MIFIADFISLVLVNEVKEQRNGTKKMLAKKSDVLRRFVSGNTSILPSILHEIEKHPTQKCLK